MRAIELDNLDRQIQAKHRRREPAAGTDGDVSGAHRGGAAARSGTGRADARLRNAAADAIAACCRRKKSRRCPRTSRSGRSASSSRSSIRARMPEKPASPDRPRLYLMALFGGDWRPASALAALSGIFRSHLAHRGRCPGGAEPDGAGDRAVDSRRGGCGAPLAAESGGRRGRADGAGRRRRRRVEAVEIVMYERYYGLQERPFDLSPNPRFLCFTPQHREALVHLEYGLAGRPGVTVLLGEAGHRQDDAGSRGAARLELARRRSSICPIRR